MRFFSILRGAGVLLLLGLWPLPAFGQQPDTTGVLDLQALLADVATRNPSLRAARLEADALGTRRRQVTALPDPSFMVSYQPFPMLTGHGFQRTMWSFEQMIPFPGKLGLRGDIADLSADIAGDEAETMALDLALQVKQAYYELYRTQAQDRHIAAFEAQLRDFEEVAATRYEVGVGMQQDILKAQLEQNQLRLWRERLAEEERTALDVLARLIDRPDVTSLAGTARVSLPSFNAVQDTLLTLALARRPEAQALRHADALADRQIDLARQDFRPDFTVNLTYFDMAPADAPPTADGSDALAVGLGVRVPLWRGRLRANLEEAEVNRRQVAARLEALEATFRTQIDDLLSQLYRRQRQLDLYRTTLIPQAETTLEATLSGYNTGRANFLDLLDADRTLFSLRLDEAETLARYLQTTAALERALGVHSLAEIDTR